MRALRIEIIQFSKKFLQKSTQKQKKHRFNFKPERGHVLIGLIYALLLEAKRRRIWAGNQWPGMFGGRMRYRFGFRIALTAFVFGLGHGFLLLLGLLPAVA